MGLVKWVRRRIEAASGNRKLANNEIDERGYARPLEVRPQQPDEINLPACSIPDPKFKRIGTLFKRYRRKSVSGPNCTCNDPARASSQKSSQDLGSASQKIVDHEYEIIHEAQYANVDVLSPTRRHSISSTSRKPILFPREKLTQSHMTHNQRGIVQASKYQNRLTSLMINSQSSPAISRAVHVSKAVRQEVVSHEPTSTSGLITEHLRLGNRDGVYRRKIQTTGQSSRSVDDLHDQREAILVDFSDFRRQEPVGCEDADLEKGNMTLIGALCSSLNSTFNFETPVVCETDMLRTPGWTWNCRKSMFDVLPFDDGKRHSRVNTVALHTPGNTYENSESMFDVVPLEDGNTHSYANTAVLRTPGWTYEYDSTTFDVLPYEDTETHGGANNLGQNSRDSDDEMSMYQMTQAIKVLQNQMNKKILAMTKKQGRRSTLELTAV